ncbi:MAG: hypothetical protein M3P83_08265 [Actinomycetota bacterium]|nr:hypothetical protein [Actinomycetota bacterium]
MSTGALTATTAFAGLLDDAAIFPPGNLPLPEAVTAHHQHRGQWYADLVGPFVCSDTHLPELVTLHDDTPPLGVTVTVSGGAGAVPPVLIWCAREDRLELRAVEVALRDEPEPARHVRRLTTVLDALPDPAMVAVEVPRLHGDEPAPAWLGVLDAVAAAGYRLKYRTGGLDLHAFPTDTELARVIGAALDRELPFKCTAGLHHGVRRTAPGTGFEEHGFLNVLLATRAALDSADTGEVARLLAERDATAVADRVRALGDNAVATTRRWFTSFGSCSIAEPVDELVRLGLLAPEA